MKQVLLIIAASLLGISIQAQSKKEQQVQNAVEALRKAMVDGDKVLLEKIADDRLSYGHSGGHIDDKKQFVEKLTTGKSDFVTLDLTEQSIIISGKTAIVRHKLSAKTNDGGKPAEVHLLVMLVWQKKKGRWVLLARQAVKE